MGEFHYGRYLADEWHEELLKVRAGGVTAVATYVFRNLHEERRGAFDWSGDRDLRRFVMTCAELGLDVVVRIGPWGHGESRNGGLGATWTASRGPGTWAAPSSAVAWWPTSSGTAPSGRSACAGSARTSWSTSWSCGCCRCARTSPSSSPLTYARRRLKEAACWSRARPRWSRCLARSSPASDDDGTAGGTGALPAVAISRTAP
ncbi:hypothetical protein GBF35_26910 [Nonomuraea phyllanthi]|nr:hypothetical protein GBF35_26910 [Nonomuraea phyllanthi]